MSARNFQVHIHRNLPYADLMRLLERTAAMDHSRFDSFALVLLSHGNQVWKFVQPFITFTTFKNSLCQ